MVSYRASTVASGVNLLREKLQDAAGRIGLLVDECCRKIVSDFLHYRKKPHSDEPLKDNISDHTMDALRYFLVNYYQRDPARFRDMVGPRVAGLGR